MVYGIRKFTDSLWVVPSWSCSQTVSKSVWLIPLLCVQWKTADDGQRNCPKHVEFYSKYKFEKLEHLVGFIIRIYHDARSPESQIPTYIFCCVDISSSLYFVIHNAYYIYRLILCFDLLQIYFSVDFFWLLNLVFLLNNRCHEIDLFSTNKLL